MVEQPKHGGNVDVGALWTDPDSDGGKDTLHGGRFVVDVSKRPMPLATAAPGMR